MASIYFSKGCVFFAVTLLSLTGCVVTKRVDCFDCIFTRNVGIEHGNEACLSPEDSMMEEEGEEEGSSNHIQIVSCEEKCIVIKRKADIKRDGLNENDNNLARVTDTERYMYVYRGCAGDGCRSGTYFFGGYESENFCCASNMCNHATSMGGYGISFVLCVVIVFLLKLL